MRTADGDLLHLRTPCLYVPEFQTDRLTLLCRTTWLDYYRTLLPACTCRWSVPAVVHAAELPCAMANHGPYYRYLPVFGRGFIPFYAPPYPGRLVSVAPRCTLRLPACADSALPSCPLVALLLRTADMTRLGSGLHAARILPATPCGSRPPGPLRQLLFTFPFPRHLAFTTAYRCRIMPVIYSTLLPPSCPYTLHYLLPRQYARVWFARADPRAYP